MGDDSPSLELGASEKQVKKVARSKRRSKGKKKVNEVPHDYENVGQCSEEALLLVSKRQQADRQNVSEESKRKAKRKRAKNKKSGLDETSTGKSTKRPPRPNFFLAIRVDNPEIVSNIQMVQQSMLEKDEALADILVHPQKAHVTLHVFHSEEDNLPQLEEMMMETMRDVSDVNMHFKGMGDFGKQVIFAKLENAKDLEDLWEALANRLKSMDNLAFKQDKAFKPHLTIMKTSKAKTSAMRKRKIAQAEFYEKFADLDFGMQSCSSLQLLSMTKKPCEDTGFYHKFFEVPFPQTTLSTMAKSLHDDKDTVRQSVRNRICSVLEANRLRTFLFNPRTLFLSSLLVFTAWKVRRHLRR